MRDTTKTLILSTLATAPPNGLTVTALAGIVERHPSTVRKALAVLVTAGHVVRSVDTTTPFVTYALRNPLTPTMPADEAVPTPHAFEVQGCTLEAQVTHPGIRYLATLDADAALGALEERRYYGSRALVRADLASAVGQGVTVAAAIEDLASDVSSMLLDYPPTPSDTPPAHNAYVTTNGSAPTCPSCHRHNAMLALESMGLVGQVVTCRDCGTRAVLVDRGAPTAPTAPTPHQMAKADQDDTARQFILGLRSGPAGVMAPSAPTDDDLLPHLAETLTLADRLDGGGYAWEPLVSADVPTYAAAIDLEDLDGCGYSVEVTESYGVIVVAVPLSAYGEGADALPAFFTVPADGGESAYYTRIPDTGGSMQGYDPECTGCGTGCGYPEDDPSTCGRCGNEDAHNEPGTIDRDPIGYAAYAVADYDELDDVEEGATRAVWASVWAAASERFGVSLSGQDVLETAPTLPEDEETQAAAWFAALVEQCGGPTKVLGALAITKAVDHTDAEAFGATFGLWALGHGVDASTWAHTLPDVLTEAPACMEAALDIGPDPDDLAALDADDRDTVTRWVDGCAPRAELVACVIAGNSREIYKEALALLDDGAYDALDLSPLHLIGYLTSGQGIESIPRPGGHTGDGDPIAEYVNQGDTYLFTVVRWLDDVAACSDGLDTYPEQSKGEYSITCYGNAVQQVEGAAVAEAMPDPNTSSEPDRGTAWAGDGTVTIRVLSHCMPGYFQGHSPREGTAVLAVPTGPFDTTADLLDSLADAFERDAWGVGCFPEELGESHVRAAFCAALRPEALPDAGRNAWASDLDPVEYVNSPDGDTCYLYVLVSYDLDQDQDQDTYPDTVTSTRKLFTILPDYRHPAPYAALGATVPGTAGGHVRNAWSAPAGTSLATIQQCEGIRAACVGTPGANTWREAFPFVRPGALVRIAQPNTDTGTPTADVIGEAMAYPDPDGTAHVRATPGDATSAQHVSLSRVYEVVTDDNMREAIATLLDSGTLADGTPVRYTPDYEGAEVAALVAATIRSGQQLGKSEEATREFLDMVGEGLPRVRARDDKRGPNRATRRRNGRGRPRDRRRGF